MSPKTRRREEADRILLAEGPKPVAELMLLMMRFITPGHAAREAERHRNWIRQRNNCRMVRSSSLDIYEIGRRRVARSTLVTAVRSGMWIRTGDIIRHRDWNKEEGHSDIDQD